METHPIVHKVSVTTISNVEELKIRLEDLEQSIKQLQSQLDTLTNERDLVRSQLHHQLNAAAPVSRLPVETLSQIFNHCISGRSMYHGRRLLLVCRRWYEVAIADPTLWIDVRLDLDYSKKDGLLEESLRFIDACYQRSGSLGLHITLDISNLGNRGWEDDDENDHHYKQGSDAARSLLSNLLKRDMSRWKSFYFWWSRDYDLEASHGELNPTSLNDLLQRATQVEHVSIENMGDKFDIQLVLYPVASRLTSLTLYNATWDLGRFPGVQFPCLKQLYVEHWEDDHWSVAINTAWLDPFPRLEELTLSSRIGKNIRNEPNESGVHRSLHIPAPSLKKLCLIGRLPHTMLAALQSPALETLQVIGNRSYTASIEIANKLTFAKGIKTLILQRISVQHSFNHPLINLILSFSHLVTVTVDKDLLDRLASMVVGVKEMPVIGVKEPQRGLFDCTAYQLDAPILVESVKSYRRKRSAF